MKLLEGIFFIFLFLFLLMVVSGIFLMLASLIADHDTEIIKVECYDRLGHEINNLTCDKTISCNYKWNIFNDLDCKEPRGSVE